MTDVSASLAAWASEINDKWPDEAIKGSVRAFIDTIACMAAGVGEPVVLKTIEAVREFGTDKASVVGGSPKTTIRLAAPWTALVNGAAAHSQDYDDVLEPAFAHVSAVLVPAILTLAEEFGLGGHSCLDAYIVGFEIMTRLAEQFNPDHYRRGWHTTLTLGTPSAAVACGRLMGLDQQRMQGALNLSTSLCSGSKRQFGSMTKALHAGFAAMNGLVAARLAAKGITTAEEMFDGPWSLSDLMAGTHCSDFIDHIDRMGNPLGLIQYGSWLKFYPCCASTHRAIDALLDLREMHQIQAEETAVIEGLLSTVAADNLMYTVPNDSYQARFSLPYCLASALVDGSISPTSFTLDALRRPDVRKLMPRVKKIAYPKFDRDQHSQVTIHMKDGRTFSQTVKVPRGHPKRPLSDQQLAEKYKNCSIIGGIGQDEAEGLWSLLNGLPTLPRIDILTSFLEKQEE